MDANQSQLSERHFRSIARLIETKIGIQLPAAKRTMVEGRLRKRVRALGLADLNAYASHVFEEDGLNQEFVHLVDCVTTNKTDFFREPAHFRFLRDVAVPDLLRTRRGGGGPAKLKIWSSACSTGAEAYTIAMVLADMQRDTALGRFMFSILGTDISTDVLAQAKRAVYPRDMVAPVPRELAERYLLWPREEGRNEVRIAPEIRQRAKFLRLNLMDATYEVDRDVDVVFCRNVLIYFDKATQRAVIDKLRSHLRPGGYLLLGHSESMAGGPGMPMQQILPTVYQA